MKKTLILLSFTIIFCSCKHNKALDSFTSETLKIQPVSDNVFTHVSYLKTNDFGKVACNGMVYFNDDEAIVFDTPTDDKGSKELINWIEKHHKKKVKAIIVTHFHEDCLGGLQQFHEKGAKSYANTTTIEMARQNNQEVLPQYGFENELEINIGKKTAFAQFFGEGHTADNIVGYLPDEKVLFGGCLIKSVKAGKGNLEDANVTEWSKTVEKIKKEIPDLNIIIPGHGNHGGTELLDYTIQLFEE